MNKTIILAVVAGVGVLLLGVLAYVLMAEDEPPAPRLAAASGVGSRDSRTQFDFICEVTVAQPIASLDGPRKTSTQYIVGGVDLDKAAGWYAGQYAISETRKGTLTVKGNLIEVRRPALFQRFGGTVAGEEYTLDRTSGEFRQWLTFQDGQKLNLMKGHCGRFIRPPF